MEKVKWMGELGVEKKKMGDQVLGEDLIFSLCLS